jgi:hypothetical protein
VYIVDCCPNTADITAAVAHGPKVPSPIDPGHIRPAPTNDTGLIPTWQTWSPTSSQEDKRNSDIAEEWESMTYEDYYDPKDPYCAPKKEYEADGGYNPGTPARSDTAESHGGSPSYEDHHAYSVLAENWLNSGGYKYWKS